MSDTLKPLEKKSPLAPTPVGPPEWSVPVELASGEVVPMADPRATRAMIALMDMNAVMGGAACHWGGPSAFAELMSATHGLMFAESLRRKRPWYDLYSFVNDGGHCENGLYALKANYRFADLTLADLAKFRSIQSPLTGHGESHLFPQGVLISNGPLGSAFPQAQGLAMADQAAGRDRVTITAITDGGCMEGEAREAMAALPGLARAGRVAPFVLIVSDNNTKLTGRIDLDSYDMKPTFEALGTLGWHKIELAEAHDLQKCAKVIESAIARARENPKQPVVVHARTIKGYGVKKTADALTGGHGFPLKAPNELPAFLSEIYSNGEVPTAFTSWAADLEKTAANAKPPKAAASTPTQKVQVGVSKALIAKRRAGLPVVSISADLPGSTGLAEFQKAFPESTRDIGVAESNMMSVAAGFSKNGFIPVVDTFAQFGVTKGALPLTMSSLSQAPVIAIFSHVGFQDAADGASHQALSYFAMVSSIPHVHAIALSCSDEAEALVGQAVDRFKDAVRANRTPDSYVFFLGRENFPAHYGVTDFELGRAQVLRKGDGAKLVIAAAGAMVGQALAAADELAKSGVACTVVNASTINRPDVATFTEELAGAGQRLLTVEDHQIVAGMGAQLIHALVQAGVPLRARSLGVKGEFGQSAYNAIELYRKHGLDASAIVKVARELVAT